MTASCPTCRAEACPTAPASAPPAARASRPSRPEATERKVVTTLFADLVGFTALGERHDPEDVDAALRGYYALARTIVERFGGVVEKFIGDAVVGLFGVPAAHEDDAERAVRAALELVAHMHELPPVGDERLQVRCRREHRPRAGAPRTRARSRRGRARRRRRQHRGAAARGRAADGGRRRRRDDAAPDGARPSPTSDCPQVGQGQGAKPVERWLARGAIARRGIEARSVPTRRR